MLKVTERLIEPGVNVTGLSVRVSMRLVAAPEVMCGAKPKYWLPTLPTFAGRKVAAPLATESTSGGTSLAPKVAAPVLMDELLNPSSLPAPGAVTVPSGRPSKPTLLN